MEWLRLSDSGRPEGFDGAACSEDDDGADVVSVHLHLQGPHPVPPKLSADLIKGFSYLAKRHRRLQGGFSIYAKPYSINAAA